MDMDANAPAFVMRSKGSPARAAARSAMGIAIRNAIAIDMIAIWSVTGRRFRIMSETG